MGKEEGRHVCVCIDRYCLFQRVKDRGRTYRAAQVQFINLPNSPGAGPGVCSFYGCGMTSFSFQRPINEPS